MKFRLEIELGNDAMQSAQDVFDAIESHGDTNPTPFKGGESSIIRDVNGNTVGKWEVIDETACKVCGVPAAKHGHYDVSDPKTHQWKAR